MTKSRLQNTLLAVTLAGGLFTGAGSAYATPLTEFIATNTVLFDTDTTVPGVEPGGFLSVSPTQLEWVDTGDPADAHSYLRILSPANDPVPILSDTGAWTNTAQFQHENNVIPVSEFNFTVDVINAFTLSGVVFDATGDDTLAVVTPLEFVESNNSEPCLGPNPLGSVCDDTFIVSGLDQILNTFLFSALGERWALEIRILADEDSGTFFDPATNRIFTAEGELSDLFFQARIFQLEVPEPATLALLGIGLLGLPLVRRRAAKEAEPLAA